MKMKKIILATGLFGLAAVGAHANDVSGTPAVATPETHNVNAPVEGRNSFTEAQVKARLMKAGYTNIKDLMKNDNGVWTAQATKKGVPSTVSFDYQGNITAVPAAR